jgi:large repetitive protein
MNAMTTRSDEARGRGRRGTGLLGTLLACAFVAVAVSGCWFFPGPTPGSSEPTFIYVPDKELVFSPETLPGAQAGEPYDATITVSQARTPVGGAKIQDGALPDGLTLVLGENHDNSMAISGTPTTAGTYKFTVYAWCLGTNVSGQTGTHAYTLVVK